MNRRDMLKTSAAATLGLCTFPQGYTARADEPKRKLLYFTKSSGFQHSVVDRKDAPEKLSYSEQIMTDWGAKHNFEVTCTKDGTIFTPEKIATFDAFMFYTTGDLTQPDKGKKNNKKGADGKALPAAEQDLRDSTPPMSPEGKQAFLDAIKAGKGFIGSHCGSDTFHSKKGANGDIVDPYIEMVGGEFIVHGAQQKSKMVCVDQAFPGMGPGKDGFEMNEEWYALKNHAKDMHVILVQDTTGMQGKMYARPPYPATWARMYGKGRVFFTSMGHREDVWKSPIFESLLLGGLSWAFGNVQADVTPNLEKAAPNYATLGG